MFIKPVRSLVGKQCHATTVETCDIEDFPFCLGNDVVKRIHIFGIACCGGEWRDKTAFVGSFLTLLLGSWSANDSIIEAGYNKPAVGRFSTPLSIVSIT